MGFYFFAALSLTIAIPAFICLYRLRTIEPVFVPFVLLTWLGFLTEAGGLLLITHHHSNLLLYNVYSLGEFWLLLWQFRRWKLFDSKGSVYIFIIISGTLWWLAEGFVTGQLHQPTSYFLIGSSFVIVVISILTISNMVFFETYWLFKNPKFLMCIGFILFFSYSILVEVFLLFGLGGSRVFRNNIYEILYYINAFVNLIYAYSILCMPMRLRFIGR